MERHTAQSSTRTVALLGTALVLGSLLVVELPPLSSSLLRAAENAAHAPIFALVALAVWPLARNRWRTRPALAYTFAFVAAFGIGFAFEVVQFFGPRDASLEDLVTNALGAGGALTMHAAWSPPERVRRSPWTRGTLLVIAVFCVGAVLTPVLQAAAALRERDRQFPVVADFDSRLDLHLIENRRVAVKRVPWPAEYARPGDGTALRIDFTPRRAGGIIFTEPEPDWRNYEALLIDIANPANAPLAVKVRIDDAHHDKRREDRYEEVFVVPARSRQDLSIPLDAVREGPAVRDTDLGRIAALMLFRVKSHAVEHCYLGNIRLVHE